MSQQKTEEVKKIKPCPYFNDKECGHPDKIHTMRCVGYGFEKCVSYKYLEEYKEEDKKDGKQ